MQDVGKKSLSHTFVDSLRELYPGCEPVAFRSVDELPGPEPGLRLVFASNLPDFSHFLIARDGGEFTPCPDGVVVVRFGSDPQTTTLAVKAARTDGTDTPPHAITLKFTPRPDDNGALANNRLRLAAEPFLHLAPSSMDDWKFPVPTEDEIAFARDQWGSQVDPADGDYAKAKVIAKALMTDLWPHSGPPSPVMKTLQPFEQYQRMVAGEDQGFCTNFGAIFECTCKCFGVLARRIGMAEVPWVSHRLFVQSSPNHCTTEVFDRQANHWVLMDLRYDMLGAYLGEEGPLTLAEFVQFINQPARRKRLRLHTFDFETQSEQTIPLSESRRHTGASYEGWSRVFHYQKI